MEELSMEEIENERAVALPNKEVLSLLDVNANVDLGLDLAAPVDLAAAANLNVAAPIEASAAANVLSPGAEAVGVADQHGILAQNLSGSADATAPQHAGITQSGVDHAAPGATATPAAGGSADQASGAGAHPVSGVGATPEASPQATGSPAAGGAVDGLAGGAANAVGSTTGGVDSLLNGGSLLDANVNLDANAHLTAPIDGAVAANGNVAAPVDAAVGANIGSPNAVAEALAPQHVDIVQNMDNVSADATATQDANVGQS